jgi:hypothetical protein
MRPLASDLRREDPFYAHFPMLKSMLRNVAHGRRQGDLAKYARQQSLFEQWSTDMRYAPTTDVSTGMVAEWKLQAEELVSQMGL